MNVNAESTEGARKRILESSASLENEVRSGEHFIPVRGAELARHLAGSPELDPPRRRRFDEVCRLLRAELHRRYHERFLDLKEAYAPFNPDADTRWIEPPDQTRLDDLAEQVFQQCVHLLERANYRRLSREEIERAIDVTSHWGVNLTVDFDIFRNLVVYGRGETVSRRMFRGWKTRYRLEPVQTEVYQRLVVIFRLRDDAAVDDHGAENIIYLKIFKNIPKADIEMLLPGTRVRMSLLDQGRILVPTLSGIALTVFKIVKGVALVAFAGVYGLLLFLGLVGGTIGYGVKSFFGYVRTRDKYRLNLTRNLYYQNLNNNAGVLHQLLDDVEEQEFREAVLAYYLLLNGGGDNQCPSVADIDARAESLLRTLVGARVDFEVDDALRKLERFGLARAVGPDRWTAVDPERVT